MITINTSESLANLLNRAAAESDGLMIVEIDGNALRNTPPALVIVAVGRNQAARMAQILNDHGIKHNSPIVRP
jgi:hypothetical protein